MAVTVADINKLRKQTGAGMMDCKKALTEADGDFDAAIDILRKKGQKVAAKRGDNEAHEGLIIAKANADGKSGVILKLNCETDFVARNQDFYNFVDTIVNVALTNMPADADALKALPYDDKLSVADKITEQVGVIGEKLDLSGYATLNADLVAVYNHPGNQLAAIVGLNKNNDSAKDAGHQVAMQVAAMAPLAIDANGVEQSVLDHELEIGKELAIQEGKPADMAEKISQGRLHKFLKENTLLSQPFVKDSKVTVQDFLNSVDKDLTVSDFKRFSLK